MACSHAPASGCATPMSREHSRSATFVPLSCRAPRRRAPPRSPSAPATSPIGWPVRSCAGRGGWSCTRGLLKTSSRLLFTGLDPECKTRTTRGGRRARHPKTTLPHRPPGPSSCGRIVGGVPAGARPFRGWLIPRPGPIHTLVWSHIGSRRLYLLPAPVRVMCARISSYRAAVCACIRGLKAWPLGAHAAPVVLAISGFDHPPATRIYVPTDGDGRGHGSGVYAPPSGPGGLPVDSVPD